MQPKTRAMLVLTAALVFVFGYSGADKLVSPHLWVGGVPLWANDVLGLSRNAWLIILGLFQICLAVLLLIPVRIIRLVGAILACVHFIAILTQAPWGETTIHTVGLLGTTLALLCLI